MIQVQGRVLSVSAAGPRSYATVAVKAEVACARCAAGKGCGAGIFGSSEQDRRIDALVMPGVDVHEGQQVSVELEARNVLRAAAIAYGMPLAGGVLGAAIAWWSGSGDAMAAGLALIGIAAGILAGRWRLGRETCLRQFTPVVRAADVAEGRD